MDTLNSEAASHMGAMEGVSAAMRDKGAMNAETANAMIKYSKILRQRLEKQAKASHRRFGTMGTPC